MKCHIITPPVQKVAVTLGEPKRSVQILLGRPVMARNTERLSVNVKGQSLGCHPVVSSSLDGDSSIRSAS